MWSDLSIPFSRVKTGGGCPGIQGDHQSVRQLGGGRGPSESWWESGRSTREVRTDGEGRALNTFHRQSADGYREGATYQGFPGGASNEEPTCQCRRHETWVWSRGQEDPLEGSMASHSSILVWGISWTEEPGRLHSVGSQRAGRNDLALITHFTGEKTDLVSHLLT